MAHQRALWITPMVEKGQYVQIFLRLLLELGHEYIASDISTKVEAQD